MMKPDRERFLQALLDSATDYAIISMDLDGLVTTWNEGAHRILGWSEAEIVGQPASVFFTVEDRRKGVPQAEMQAALAAGRGNDERWRQRKDGSRFWASGETMALKDPDGSVQGFIKILRDRTDQRKAEEDLCESDTYVRLLLDSAAGGFYAVDRDGVTTLCNPAFLKMLGFAREEDALGRKLHEVIHHSHSDGSHYAAPDCPIYVCAREGVPAHVIDEVFYRLDGSVLPVEYWVHPILREGRLQGAVCSFLDISERRQAEAELRESQDRLQLTLSNAQIVGTWDWDVVNDRVYADERFARLHAVDPRQAAEGATLGAFTAAVHPLDRDRLATEIDKAVATGEPYAAEYRLIQTDGSIRHVLARGRSVGDAHGRSVRFPGVVVDITELRHAEETLRTTQRAGGVGSFELHPDTGLLDISEEFREIWGLPEDVTALHVDTLVDLLLPEDGAQPWPDIVKNVKTHLGAVEYRIRRPTDGHVRWIARRSQEFDENGRRRVLGIVQDVTDRVMAQQALKASEAQFRTFAQAMPIHVWTAPPNGRLDWFNQRVYDYTGLAPGDLDGDDWAGVVHPADLARATERWRASLASGETYEVEFRIRRADDVYRWHLVRAVAIRDDGGAIVRWIGANTDIEDQKIAADALIDLNATLEHQVNQRTGELMAAEEALRQAQKMEAVGQLTGGIAHDFNNLLTGITGALDLVKRRLEAGRTDDLDRFMDAASTSAQRAAALTHRLLAFARRQSLDTKPSEVNPLITGLEDLLRRTLGEQVELEAVLDLGLWRAMADANQLESALLNLAINARDAMPGGGKLTIETSNTRLDDAYARVNDNVEAGDYVVISVSDTGTGMAPGVVAKAFDPFFTTKPIGEGTGLGLSMIYGFVKQSGGHVRIYSELGRGTTVKLYLRRALQDGEPAILEPSPDAPRGRGEMVLVVEDDAAVRLLMTEVLTELGYRYMEAADARAALPTLESALPIDLLVTDVGLPVMNGRQLAEIARQHRPSLKVLFVTGYAENAALRGDFLAPGMEMMTKPFALDALGAKIRGMIER